MIPPEPLIPPCRAASLPSRVQKPQLVGLLKKSSSVGIHPSLIPSRRACAPYRGFDPTEEVGSNLRYKRSFLSRVLPSAATQGEERDVGGLRGGGAQTGVFNSSLSGGIFNSPLRVGIDFPSAGIIRAHFPAIAAAGFSLRRGMLERPPVGLRFFRRRPRRGGRESGRRSGETRNLNNANNNF